MNSTIFDLDTQTSYCYDSGYSEQSQGSTSSSSSMIHSPMCKSEYNSFQNLVLSDSDSGMMSEVHCEGKNLFSIPLAQAESNCYLKIVEQPTDKFRFRYKSEMHGTHGSLMGARNSKSKKTFPTVELKGFDGKALIRCSLYQTGTQGHLPHSHQLVVRKNDIDVSDPHEYELNPEKGYQAIFPGMGIIHTAKKFISESLCEKKNKIKEWEIGRACTMKEISQLKIDSDKQSKLMNLNQVRLCFTAYKIHKNKDLEELCKPIFSNPINNMKSALTGELKISRLSSGVSSVNGGDDIVLLVEKVGKKNIKVKFFELNDEDEEVWHDWGQFTEADVHHQYAIALRTPPYRNKNINKHVDVFIQLFRPTDGDQSEPIAFKYKPREFCASRKRARTSSSSSFSSTDIPESVMKDFSDDKSGTTISEEFDKNQIISTLLDTQKNSDELIQEINPSIFEETIDYDENFLQIDGVVTQRNKKEKITTKICNILRRIDNSSEGAMKTATLIIVNLFAVANSNEEDILHNVVQNDEIGEAMKILKIIDKLKIYNVLNLRNNNGDTCLHIACAYDRPAYIKPLINLGVDVNMQNNQGNTALHIAVEENISMGISKILEKHNYTKLSTPLYIDLANDNGFTPLHLAVFKKRLDLVKQLLEIGNASVKICISKTGNNVLHLAIEQNNFEIVEYLLNNTSVKINQPNSSGFTPLALAQSSGKSALKIVELLLIKLAISNYSGNKIEYELKLKSGMNTKEIEDNVSSDDEENLLKIDESQIDDQMDYSEIEINYLNDITIKKLSDILRNNEKWKKLAKILNLDDLLCLWRTPEIMFKHITKNQIPVQKIIDGLKECKEFDAIKCIEENIND